MMPKKSGKSSELAQLADAIVDSVMNLSEADLDAEMKDAGLDPAVETAKGRAAIAAGLKTFTKAEMEAAKAELQRHKTGQRLGHTQDELAAARSVFDRMKAGDSDLSSKMMMAARKGEGLSDKDIDGIAEDLADLEKLGRDQE